MAQEFRTFTQRVTDEKSRLDRILNRGGTRVFNVQAKTLVDQFGNDVVDANGDKIWFPVTFDPGAAITFGKSLGRLPASTKSAAMLLSFVRGGPWDLQRSYNGQSNAPFAEVFTRAASYTLGLVGAAAGHSQTALMAGGGMHNLVVNPKTAGLNFGNNPKNPPYIAQGFRDYFGSVFAPPAMIPPGTFEGNQAADRIKTAFDHSFNGLPDNFNRLAPSVINGNVAPTAGFGDPSAGNRPPGYSLPPAASSEVDANRRYLTRRIAGQPRASVVDTGAPPVPLAPTNDFLAPDTKTSFSDRFGDRASSGFNDSIGKRTSDPFSPDTPGGLAGRLAALAGIDPANPDPRVLTPPANGFHNDELPQHWLFRGLTGRLR
jgi:hypothetical protein